MNKDLLNRQEFVDRVIRVIELQSEQKKTSCFAINGKWGVGKSFVLEMLEEQLEKIQSKETSTDKYMIFHYNCWQYDYYEEPLVAIVASMLDTIDEKDNLIPSEIKTKIKGFLKAVGSALLLNANEAIKKKTGIDAKEIFDVITNATKESAEEIEKKHNYDSNFLFKATLKTLQETLIELSEYKTIVFVVDELDRCLPEYAIKVLERLHHVFDSIDNVQVILSIDKSQLEHIIKKTFGENTETQKYLSKFIDFEVNLDEGSFSDKEEFDNKFAFYLQSFGYLSKYTLPEQVDEFKSKIFGGIDIRLCIEIIEKCNLLHRLLNKGNEKTDFSIMCVEILYTINKVLRLEIIHPKQTFNINTMNRKQVLSEGIKFLYDIYQEEAKRDNSYLLSYGKSVVYLRDIYGFILACVRLNDTDAYNEFGKHTYDIEEAKKYISKYNELLNIIN